MKKQLLSILAALTVGSVMAQVPAAAWSTNQNAIFPTTAVNTGVKYMDAVDANVVWVIGWDLAAPNRNYNWYSRTINGGSTFAGGNIFSDTNTFKLANMEAIDANTAWVCSYLKTGPGGANSGGAIHRTTNGGATWTNMTATGMYTSTTCFANWVTFLTPSVGIANGDPVNGEFELWRTTDGGISWNQVPAASIPNPNPGEFAIVNLYAKQGTSNVWFGTNSNRMFRSTNAGITWSASSVGPATNTITEIAFSGPNNGICYMANSSNALELWHSFDGGATWTQINPLPANLGFADIGAIPGTGNLVSYGSGTGNEIISYSGNNGVTWTDWGSTGIPYITGDFVNGTTAWAGSLDFSTFTDVWKYSGPAITGTVAPVSAFSIPNAICLSGPSATVIPVNTSFGSPALTYSWTVLPAGATISAPTASAPTITFNSGNTYTVTLVSTNAVGSNSTSWVVTVAACIAPIANFNLPTTACTNFSFSAVNTSTGSPIPGYFWSVSPATGVTISPSAIGTSPVIKTNAAGIYSITLFASNASGTTQTTQTLNVAPCGPNTNFTIPNTFYFCDNKTFSTTNTTSNPSGVTGSITYTWSVLPTTGVSVFPNYFQQNLVVTVTSSTVAQYTVTLKAKNASATSTVSQVVSADMCTGINENNFLAQNIQVYPNPAHDQLNVVLPASSETYHVKVINILGEVIYNETTIKNTKDNLSINMTSKPRGVYFLSVETNHEKVTKKVVVE